MFHCNDINGQSVIKNLEVKKGIVISGFIN